MFCAACGSAGTSQATGGYLAKGVSYVAFLQLTASGSTVRGSLTTATLSTDTVRPRSASFTGTSSDTSISVTFAEGFGAERTLTGERRGSEIVLSVPTMEGALVSMRFVPADSTAYNRALDALRAKAADVQRQEAAAAQGVAEASAAASQAAAAEARAAAARKAVDNAAANLRHDGRDLNDDKLFAGPLSGATKALDQQQADLAKMRAQEQKTASSPPSDACYQAGSVSYDAGQVRYDAGNVEYERSSVNYDVQVVSTRIDTATSDIVQYRSSLAAASPYVPGDPSDLDALQSAMTALKTKGDRAVATLDGQVKQAHAVATSAESEAADFSKRYC
jgi:hypothetical protein